MRSRDPLLVRNPGRALALGAALALALAGAASAEPHLSRATGDVQIGRGEPVVWQVAREGAELGAGEVVRTGNDGRAEVDMGSAVGRLYENSLLRLPVDGTRPEGPAAVGLDGGSSLFEVVPRPPQDPFEVRTPEVVASVKGTQFGVTLGERGAAAVSVFSGQVGVRGRSAANAREVMVYPGFAASGGAGRPFELSLVPAGDAWSGWSQGKPPLPAPAALGSPSADAQSLDEAKMAAQGAAAREMAAHPKVDPNGLSAKGGANAPAEIDKDGVAEEVLEPDRTSIDKAVAVDSPTSRPIQEEVAGAILNGAVPGGSPAPGLGPLTVQLVTQGGPNSILVSGTQGAIGSITEKQVETVLETGSAASLPAGVVAALNANGVNPVTFAKQLSTLLH